MDEHMRNVVNDSLLCYKESGGCFDITTGALTELWGFGLNRHQDIPSSDEIKKRLAITGSKYLVVRKDSLIALKKGIRIDCNGIAQGYTVDVIAEFMSGKGVGQFMVELGGEIRVKGEHPEKGLWRIGVESPDILAGDWHPVQQVIGLSNVSITTSGNYRKFFNAGGKMYSHVIDPLKGKPVDNGIIAVTVIATDAIKADAWDNALYVMGMEKAMQYLEKRKDLEAYIIYRSREGVVKDTVTAGFQKLLQ
jgi:thiamine biosynthesis lipoprotein